MNESDFEFISQLLRKRSGLALTQEKIYLLENRLLPIARSYNCQELSDLIALLRNGPDEKMVADVVDAMTTNESMFFRDSKPFEQLRRVILPRIRQARSSGCIRIWSAACSNGQEPYSVAMSLLEEASPAGFTYEIFATDISARVIEKARNGIYTQFEIQRGLPVALMLKYFQQVEGNHWQARESLRAMVNFRPQNLLEDMSAMGKFDIILCRNVLIYFDEPTKRNILDKISHMLSPHGVLLLGSSEMTMGLSPKYQTLENERGIYILSIQ